MRGSIGAIGSIGHKRIVNLTGVPAWTPRSIDGCILWLEADVLALNDNDPVGTWEDQSDSGWDFSQGAADNKPTYKVNIFGTLPAVYFTTNDFLELTNTAYVLKETHTLLIVYSGRVGVNGNMIPCTNNFGPLIRDAVHFFDFGWGPVNMAGDTLNNSTLLVIQADYNNDVYKIRLDGAEVGADADAHAYPTAQFKDLARTWYLGQRGNTTEFVTANIAAAVMWDSYLSAEDLATIESEFTTKYGL